MGLFVVEKLVDDVMLVDLRGRVVLGEETELLRVRLKRLLEEGHRRIVLNLQEVAYIDSSGLSTLITSFVSARRQGGDVKLLRLTGRVSDVLQITKLSTVFEIYDTFDQAQRSFSNPAEP